VKPGESSRRGPPPSRLPRRVNQYGSVAELVKRYQDYLPPQGVQELTRTALAPHYPPSESEQEYVPKPGPRSILRNRGRVMSTLAKKPSTSDFEHSYAANVAPRYLTQRARPHHLQPRLAGSLALESAQPSRRVSPEKQASSEARDGDSTIKAARASSPPASGSKSALTTLKLGKGKAPARPGVGKDKSQPPPRQPNNAPSGRTTLRRSSFAPGGKVGGLAKQFEKISKETERAQRRYSVIRGRRARPVTTARARVQVLESLKDAIRDDDESSSDSSEADDEGGEGEEEEGADPAETPVKEVPETIATALEPVAEGDSPAVPDAEAVASTSASGDAQGSQADEEPAVPAQPLPEQTSFVPPSPLMAAFPGLRQPPPPDLDLSGHFERHSILRALSGFWGQQPLYRGRSELDGDDPMADPEHIIRDSSMVVRTDEPTSIIALALKYVPTFLLGYDTDSLIDLTSSSPQYREMLTRSRAEKRGTREPKLTETGEAFMPDDRSVADSTSTWGVVNMADVVETSNPTDDMRVPSSKLPWAICKSWVSDGQD
jgi:1-phosphatidylinositol-3-phosphate 5-kinase